MSEDTIVKNAKEYISKALGALPEGHRDREYFERFLNSVDTAAELADTKEKELMLKDTSVKVANQLSFILFREKLLTDELEAEYRKLPSPETTETELKEENAKRKEAQEELQKQITEAQNAQKEVDVFMQVMGGLSKEEAEKRYEEYRQAGGR